MTDLSGYRTRIRILLGDVESERYSDALLDEALRWGLAAYSKSLPLVKVEPITVAAAGNQQSLSSLTDLVNVLDVNIPYLAGSQKPNVWEQWVFTRLDGEGFLFFSGTAIPQAGDVMQITYTAWHTISGLDEAASTTIPEIHDSLVVHGAAGKAGLLRAMQLIEAFGGKTGEPDRLLDWAQRRMADFLGELTSLKSGQQRYPPSAGGWRLDHWDTQQSRS